MEPNPNGFPLNDAEYQEIGVIGDPNYQPFDIRVIPGDQYDRLTAHGVDVPAELEQGDQAFFVHEACPIYDPLQPGVNVPDTLEMYVWHNHSSKRVRGVAVLLHLKREMCGVIEEVIRDWCAHYPNQQYKVGVEVKAIFKKVLHGWQEPDKALLDKRIMFVHQVLNKVFMDVLVDDNYEVWEALSSLVNVFKNQCYDNNHAYSSAHTIEDVVKFCVHIYCALALRPGRMFLPLPRRIMMSGVVINPWNYDDQCFKYCIY